MYDMQRMIEEGRRLLKAATPGDWHVVGPPWREIRDHLISTTYVVAGNIDPQAGIPVLDGIEIDEWESEQERQSHIAQSDADLSCAAWLKTNASDLFREAERAVLFEDAMRKALFFINRSSPHTAARVLGEALGGNHEPIRDPEATGRNAERKEQP